MKRIILLIVFMFFAFNAWADRNVATTTTYNSSILIKTGDAKLYSVTFVATAAGGHFEIYDALTRTSGNTDVRAEGSEATSANSQRQDFSNKPLEFRTGLYIYIVDGYAIVSYE